VRDRSGRHDGLFADERQNAERLDRAFASAPRPAASTRFQKGQSGNPKGRPRKHAASDAALVTERPAGTELDPFVAAFLDLAHREITLRENGEERRIATFAAVGLALMKKALEGDPRAQRLFFERLQKARQAEQAVAIAREAEEKRAAEKRERIYVYWSRRKADNAVLLAKAAASKMPPPTIYPHPDHIVLDPDARTVALTGPFDAESAVDWSKIEALIEQQIETSAQFVELMIHQSEWDSRHWSPRLGLPRWKIDTWSLLMAFIFELKLPVERRWSEQEWQNRLQTLEYIPKRRLKAELTRLWRAVTDGAVTTVVPWPLRSKHITTQAIIANARSALQAKGLIADHADEDEDEAESNR
jgi:hypothetical protein